MNTDEIQKLYAMTDRERAVGKLVAQMIDQWTDIGLFRSCLNCQHWNNDAHKLYPETCAKYENARPPARVIVTGCPDHSDNIPF